MSIMFLGGKIAMSEDYPYLSCHLPPKLYELFCNWQEKHKYTSDSEALIAVLVQFLMAGTEQAEQMPASQIGNPRSPDPIVLQEVSDLAKKSIAWTTN
jgi:hypothetical protein